MTRRLAIVWACLAPIACAGTPPVVSGPAMPVHEEASATLQNLGRPIGVFGAGARRIIVASRGVAEWAGGSIVASQASASGWTAAASIPAPDHAGACICAIASDGSLWRIHEGLVAERIDARYALSGTAVTALAAYDSDGVAFALEHGLAVANGTRVSRFDTPPIRELAGGRGRIAMLDGDGVLRVFSPGTGRWTTYRERIDHIAMGPDGALWASADTAVYREQEDQALGRVANLAHTVRSIVAGVGGLWVVHGSDVSWVQGNVVRPSMGMPMGANDRIAMVGDDLWRLGPDSVSLEAAALGGATSGERDEWAVVVSPVFHQACAPCHLPGGTADVDLSTERAWEQHRVVIRARLLVDRDMPPAGHALPEGDRARIAHWLDALGSHAPRPAS